MIEERRQLFLEEWVFRKGRGREEARGMKGWLAGQSVKRGDKTLASIPRERKGEDFTR